MRRKNGYENNKKDNGSAHMYDAIVKASADDYLLWKWRWLINLFGFNAVGNKIIGVANF